MRWFSQSPDYEASVPVTEKSNPLTWDLDRASANDIVRMLEACDSQIFHHRERGGGYQVDKHTCRVATCLFFFLRNYFLFIPSS